MLITLETSRREEQHNAPRPVRVSAAIMDRLMLGSGPEVLEVIAAINSYTRTAIREESFTRLILPPAPPDNAEIVLC